MMRESMLVAEDETQAELNLLDYWLLVRKHTRQILKLAGIITLLATLVVFQMTPVYRSTASVLIENSKSKALSLADLYDAQGAGGQESFNSQVQILKSRPVAELVIRKLKLVDHPAMDPRQHRHWYSSDPSGTAEEIEAAMFEAVLGNFENSLTVEPVLKSQIVKVSFDSTDKELAAAVANAVVDAYIENDLDSRSQMTQRANVWLTKRMEGLRKKLEESEKALQGYREQENIIDTKGVVLSGTGKQYDEISSNLVAARLRMAEAQSAYNQVKGKKGEPIEVLESIPAVRKDPTVQQMKQAESEAMRKVTEFQSRYASAHPKMIAAEAELKSAREALERAVGAVIDGIDREYEIARSNVAAAAGAQSQTKAEIQNLTRKEFQLSVLQREVDSNKQLYDMFVTRAKETDVASNLQATAGRLVDPAVVSPSPLKPKKLLVILISALLGLLAGVALVFVRDYLDNTLHTVADVERRLGVDVLGTVNILEPGTQTVPARAFLEDPNSLFAESIRTTRTAVLLSAIDDPHRVVMVTSTLPGEGKTTISTNLAFALGQMKRVLLIDGDLRRPSLAKAIGGLDDARGLVDYLADEVPLKECIHKTDSPNVFVLPAGKRFNSPLELLSSQRFGETIAKVKELFDVVVIDCPPLKPVSDSLVISGYASAVLYVVKADATPHQLINAAIRRLHDIDAPLLGVVFNQMDYKKAEHYGSYSYQYQYAYGQEPQAPAKSFMGIKI